MYGVNLNVLAERRAALHFKATRLQARAVDAASRIVCLTDGPWDIVATFEVLQYDSGFTAMSSGVRVPSEFTSPKSCCQKVYEE